MKKSKLFVVITIIAMIGFSIIACTGDPIALSISGIPRVGETITATPSSNWTSSRGDGNIMWEFSAVGNQDEWFEHVKINVIWNNVNHGVVSGSIHQYLTIPGPGVNYEGRYIRAVRLTPQPYRIVSNVIGPILP